MNLIQDWDGSPVNYTCYTNKYPLPLKKDVEPIITCDSLPPGNYSVNIIFEFRIKFSSLKVCLNPSHPISAWTNLSTTLHVFLPSKFTFKRSRTVIFIFLFKRGAPSYMADLRRISICTPSTVAAQHRGGSY